MKAFNIRAGSVAVLSIQRCCPGLGPGHGLREKHHCSHLFVTEKWSLPLAFLLTSAFASSSSAVTELIEIMTKKSTKIFVKSQAKISTIPIMMIKKRPCTVEQVDIVKTELNIKKCHLPKVSVRHSHDGISC